MRTMVGRATAALTFVGMAAPLTAQMLARPLGIPETRMGSGTSWLPDSSPMHASHHPLGQWTVMLHGLGFLQYDHQGGPRGSDQLGFSNWAMAMATRPASGGQLQLRAMVSAEPWTIGRRGYPLLVQTGETYKGAALRDRQHPHDLFMELAALYERGIGHNVGISLYLAPAGEPAVGPVAFPHRPSAAGDPLAPLSHHWQDGAHITFGVLTAGLFTRTAKLEASWFNGREPDENRTNLDYRGRRLDSYSARLSLNPDPRWSLNVSYADVKSPEVLHPDESLHRVSASVMTVQSAGKGGTWSTALVYGANDPTGAAPPTHSMVLESNLDLARSSLFARLEYVRKSAEDLMIPAALPEAAYDVSAVALGYVRRVGHGVGFEAGLGIRGSVNFLPAALQVAYGSRSPMGVAVYLRIRPAARAMNATSMPGMHH